MIESKLINQMTNSHILVQDFSYFEPVSIHEALGMLKEHGKTARIIAGGTHLLTVLKMERETPAALVSLGRIPGLGGLNKTEQGGLSIGATATIYSIRHNSLVRRHYTALAEACASFGSTQIQIMGTIGGNVCNGSPAADTVPALLAFNAELGIKSIGGERRVPLSEFLLGPGRTALKEGELLTEIILPPPPIGAISGFYKISRVAADLAKASLAVVLVADGEQVLECRLALGSVAPTVIRIPRAEALLKGKAFSASLVEEAGKIVAKDITPIDDFRSTAQYRRQLCFAMTVDTLNMIWKRDSYKIDGSEEPLLPPKAQSGKPHNIPIGERQEVELNINGQLKRLHIAPNELLLNVLRERLGLKGTKYGCGLGECGACTVLMDGKAVLGCLILAASAEGKEIVTIEGLKGLGNSLDPLQDTFIEETAYQCGYCTPGFILTAKSLLAEEPHPREAEVRDYIKGNRCRCTGYTSIVRAIMKYAQEH
jgi:xanthine dehydrogenase iron-sulfur cluster and FAD-binding subunit A